MTIDKILEQQCKPTVDERKRESKALITKAIKYMEDFDYRMNEIC